MFTSMTQFYTPVIDANELIGIFYNPSLIRNSQPRNLIDIQLAIDLQLIGYAQICLEFFDQLRHQPDVDRHPVRRFTIQHG